MHDTFYCEKCDNTTMPYYPFFLKKMKQIQRLCKEINVSEVMKYCSDFSQEYRENKCSKCKKGKYYRLGNIFWSSSIKHKIKTHKRYPSEYFIKAVINTVIIKKYIINPPIKLNNNQINNFDLIPLRYNKLLIIDALMKQGSYPRYLAFDNNNNKKFIYSEHSGALVIEDKVVKSIIVSADTNRTDVDDDEIYLPVNSEFMAKYEYLFHTHPNTLKYGGRIKEGILYEFPSANDIFNFVKYYNEGKLQASIIISPEGIYLIRPIYYPKIYKLDHEIFVSLRNRILEIEKLAIDNLINENISIEKISEPDFFHEKVGKNFRYIKLYNKTIKSINIYVEYYPREKRNEEWSLMQINLPYINYFND